MSKRKDKATKLIDALITAHHLVVTKESHSPEIWDDIEEQFVTARFRLHYHIQTLQKKLSGAQAQLRAIEETPPKHERIST